MQSISYRYERDSEAPSVCSEPGGKYWQHHMRGLEYSLDSISSSGVKQSGLLLAALYLLDKLHYDDELDVPLAVAQIRKTRPQLIETYVSTENMYSLNSTNMCSQWEHSFQMKAVLPLAKWLVSAPDGLVRQ